jgi:hypothetical protein
LGGLADTKRTGRPEWEKLLQEQLNGFRFAKILASEM